MLRNRLALIIAFAVAVSTALMVAAYIRTREIQIRRELMRGREPTPVLMATQDIPESTHIDESMIALINRPADSLQPHAISNPGEAIGKIAVVPIYQNEQILDSKLERPQHASTLSAKTPSGKRAVTLAVDAITGVGGFISPGDFVDILGLFQIPTPDGKQVPITITLLQRVQVLATGRTSAPVRGSGEAGPADTVTLALTPEETELLLFARVQGQIQFSLRPKTDSAVLAQVQPMTIDKLIAHILGPTAMQPPPPPPPPAPVEHRVEIYRALNREVVTVPDRPLKSQ